MNTGAYYFWKWADNDLPGRPAEVHAALLGGELHPAPQTFDASPLLQKLETAAAKGRERGEEWNWEVSRGDATQQARFVFVTCPSLKDGSKARGTRFYRAFFPLGLSGCDEQNGQVIPSLLPKLNCFITGQRSDEPQYDISVDDLPSLLQGVDPHRSDPFAILEDRRGRYVQCKAEARRFVLEWRENYDSPADKKFDHWRAQDRARLAALNAPYHPDIPSDKDPDLLLYADVLRTFRAFILGELQPERYHWLHINHLI